VTLAVLPSLIGVSWPVARTQRWDSVKQDNLSGKRIRSSLFSYPIYNYELKFNFLRSTVALQEYQQLKDFISTVGGATNLWALNDANDNSVTSQNFGTGDGSTQYFQLVRMLNNFNEPVFILNGNPTIYVSGSPKTLGVDYSISAAGNVAFAAAPANTAPLTWTGSFYWACRFDDDQTQFVNFYQNLWQLKTLKFSTEKVDISIGTPP
jgi:hypothetical protein